MPRCRSSRHVGSEPILESEMVDEINSMVQKLINKNKDSIPPREVETFRSQTLQQALQSQAALKQALHTCVQRKLICQDAKSTIPAEGWTQVEKDLQNSLKTPNWKR